jgi:glycosyltransferase involved in cell wall biosynthesis
LKIGLLGTRGVPNRYGGFEEFAEQVSKHWSDSGHEIFVYCEDNSNNEVFEYENINQVFIKAPNLPLLTQFIYDYRSTKHALLHNLDIIYHAGYATSVVGNLLLKHRLRGKLIYNMDGLEWKRSKFNRITRWLTKRLEKTAAMSGAELVSDNKGIQDYLKTEYGVNSTLIEYGADIVDNEIKYFEGYPKIFDLVIARFEPENHIEEIIAAYENNLEETLVLIANKNTKLYQKLFSRIERSANIIFNGPIYDKEELTFLKTNCRYYIHGHSVGGTNPSLLEALAAGCNILIHGNDFNKDVVGKHARCWSDQKELEKLVSSEIIRSTTIESQKQYCMNRFNWELIAQKHIEIFKELKKKQK